MTDLVTISGFFSHIKKYYEWWLGEITCLFYRLPLLKKKHPAKFSVSLVGSVMPMVDVKNNQYDKKKIVIHICDSVIMSKTVRLPKNAVSNVSKIIEYEFDKYFPLPFSDVCVGFDLRNDIDPSYINVGISSIRKTYFDEIISKIKSEFLLPVRFVDVVNQAGEVVLTKTVHLSKNNSENITNINKPLIYRYVWVVFLMFLFAMPIFKVNSYHDYVLSNVEIAKKEAKDIIVIRNNIVSIEERLKEVVSAKRQATGIVRTWFEISEVVAGNAVLSSFNLSGNKVTMEGKAESVEKIIKLLGINKNFTNLKIEAPVRRLSNGSHETMRISLLVNYDVDKK